MDSEQMSLLKTIVAHPRDVTAKLVFADWLDEHGKEGLAEAIRLHHSEYDRANGTIKAPTQFNPNSAISHAGIGAHAVVGEIPASVNVFRPDPGSERHTPIHYAVSIRTPRSLQRSEIDGVHLANFLTTDRHIAKRIAENIEPSSGERNSGYQNLMKHFAEREASEKPKQMSKNITMIVNDDGGTAGATPKVTKFSIDRLIENLDRLLSGKPKRFAKEPVNGLRMLPFQGGLIAKSKTTPNLEEGAEAHRAKPAMPLGAGPFVGTPDARGHGDGIVHRLTTPKGQLHPNPGKAAAERVTLQKSLLSMGVPVNHPKFGREAVTRWIEAAANVAREKPNDPVVSDYLKAAQDPGQMDFHGGEAPSDIVDDYPPTDRVTGYQLAETDTGSADGASDTAYQAADSATG